MKKKCFSIVLAVILLVSTSNMTAIAESTTATTDVVVTITGAAGEFYVYDEATLRTGLATAEYNVLRFLNDVYIETAEPVTTTYRRTVTFASVPEGGVTIYQTVPNARHFNLSGMIDRVNITFDRVALDGGGVGGGLFIQYVNATLTNAVITNCVNTGNGGAAQVTWGSLRLINSELSHNIAANGGGVYIERGGASNVNDVTLTLNGGFIKNNIATNNGGGVYAHDAIFYNGRVDEMLNGGVVGDNNAANSGGGVYIAGGADAYLRNGTVSGNTAESVDGGGVFVAQGRLLTEVNSENYITGNSAPFGNGGGIFLAGLVTAPVRGNLWFVPSSKVHFGGNTASQAYWLENEENTFSYRNQTAQTLRNAYNSGGDSSFASTVTAVSLSNSGASPFTYAYNNYDIAFIGSEAGKVSPGSEVLAFDSSSTFNTLYYNAEIKTFAQSVSPTGATPNLVILDSAKNEWALKVTIGNFLVDGVVDNTLKLNLRNTGGTYSTIESGLPYTVITSAQADYQGDLVTIPWTVNGDDDLLKLLVPANAHALFNKTITVTIYWSIEPIV